MEESIAHKESAYLDSNPAGNIITGFDNYMKGTGGAAAQRRKAGSLDQNRVFSRSSVSYRPNNAACPLSVTNRDEHADLIDTPGLFDARGIDARIARAHAALCLLP